jgi:hypothetical protein
MCVGETKSNTVFRKEVLLQSLAAGSLAHARSNLLALSLSEKAELM